MSAGLQGAIESAPVTRLHEHRSYDPADFGVPSGREEEWRFTPLRRLRGLHTDSPPAPTATVAVEVDPAPEVKTFSAERAVFSLSGRVLRSPRLLAAAQRAGALGGRLVARSGRIRRLPPPLSGWTETRDAPAPPPESFRAWWARTRGGRS